MRFSFVTLGCKVNQFESNAMAELLRRHGHRLCMPEEKADVCIINTCAVTAESSRKSRQAVRHARVLHPGALIAVCGCGSQLRPDDFSGADVVFGSANREDFIDAVEQVYSNRRARIIRLDDPLSRRGFEKLPAGSGIGRTRAMLKVQDGCRNFCTYCIIPYVRGALRSMPLGDAVAEAERLEQEGFRELVVTGIEISSYGRDFEGESAPGIIELTEALCRAVPSMRIRLGSLEPRTVTQEFCERLSGLPNLCPHFHLSLQSGCAATLKRMGRRYTPEEFYTSVQLLRSFFPNCGITTDIIVGFPGEDEAEFAETLAFLRKCAFLKLHIFPYSRRPGTKAADMADQVPDNVKKERAQAAAAAEADMKRQFLKAQLGLVEDVLFETGNHGIWSGLTANYCEVRTIGDIRRGELRQVRITTANGDFLTAVLI